MQVLIFSHRARMLKLVEAIMIRKGYTFEVLTGSTPQVPLSPPGPHDFFPVLACTTYGA